MPLSLVLALVLVSQGVVQNFKSYDTVSLVQPTKDAEGKAVNDADRSRWVRPRRRLRSSNLAPTAAGSSTSTRPIRSKIRRRSSNFLELLAILLISAALCYTFGVMVGDTRQGWAVSGRHAT